MELKLVAEEGDATSQAEIIACKPPTHLAVSTHDQGGTWLLEATLTPIDSNHTRLRAAHLDEEAKSEEVGPGWEYYLDALVAPCAAIHAGLRRLLAEHGVRAPIGLRPRNPRPIRSPGQFLPSAQAVSRRACLAALGMAPRSSSHPPATPMTGSLASMRRGGAAEAFVE